MMRKFCLTEGSPAGIHPQEEWATFGGCLCFTIPLGCGSQNRSYHTFGTPDSTSPTTPFNRATKRPDFDVIARNWKPRRSQVPEVRAS